MNREYSFDLERHFRAVAAFQREADKAMVQRAEIMRQQWPLVLASSLIREPLVIRHRV